MLCGCQRHLHETNDFIRYIDKMNCNIESNYKGKIPCNLKGKYEIISDEVNNEYYRTMKIGIKNTDLIFEVESRMNRGKLSLPGYTLSNNYYEAMTNYYRNKYIDLFSNDLVFHDDSVSSIMEVSTHQEQDNAALYLDKILNAIRQDTLNYDFKVPISYYFNIEFDKEYINYNRNIFVGAHLLLTKNGYEYKMASCSESVQDDGVIRSTDVMADIGISASSKEALAAAMESAINIQMLRIELYDILEMPSSNDGKKYYGFRKKEGYIYGTNYKYIFIASGKKKFTKSNIPQDNSFTTNISNYNNVHYDDYLLENCSRAYYYLLYNEKTKKYYNVCFKRGENKESTIVYPDIRSISEIY